MSHVAPPERDAGESPDVWREGATEFCRAGSSSSVVPEAEKHPFSTASIVEQHWQPVKNSRTASCRLIMSDCRSIRRSGRSCDQSVKTRPRQLQTIKDRLVKYVKCM